VNKRGKPGQRFRGYKPGQTRDVNSLSQFRGHIPCLNVKQIPPLTGLIGPARVMSKGLLIYVKGPFFILKEFFSLNHFTYHGKLFL